MLCYFGWLDLVALRGVFCSVVIWHGECCGFCAFVGCVVACVLSIAVLGLFACWFWRGVL